MNERKIRKSGKLIYGVGVNDSDYTLSRLLGGKMVNCVFYSRWSSMLERCYSERLHKKHPPYIGCEVSEDWHSFMSFRSWMIEQAWQGKHLDKDLLHVGNTLYTKDKCIFVPQEVNKFMTDRVRFRGNLSLGVDRSGSKFRARCADLSGCEIYLGVFYTEEEAHEAYLKCKGDLAITLAGRQSDPRVAEALLKRYKVH